ncbi:MAG: metal ABC transporter permease [Verrucomicrobia bacterium]|nr:metal ABC transporter permease [Verrucomicrobiota bacterium]
MLAANPYFSKNFGEFLLIFMQRMGELLLGKIGFSDLASDEVQVLVLALVAISSSLVGTFLVLKKMTMLANSLSHTILLGIVIAYVILIPFIPEGEVHSHSISIQVLLIASLATGLITTLLTQMLTHLLKLQEDASTGLVFTTLFALGIVLVTVFTRNTHLGTEAIMGNVDALHVHDLKLILWIALFDFAVIALLFKEFKITTFDGSFASAQGFSSALFSYLLMVLTSATVIGAFRAVGVLLVLAFLVGPVLTARLFTHRLKKLIILAVAIGVFASIISVALARHLLSVHHLPLSTSGLAATVLGAIYFASLGVHCVWKRRTLTLSNNK